MTTNCSDLHNGRCLWRFRLFIPFELITNCNNICGLIGLSFRRTHLFPLQGSTVLRDGDASSRGCFTSTVHHEDVACLKRLLSRNGMIRPGLRHGVGIKPSALRIVVHGVPYTHTHESLPTQHLSFICVNK